VIAEVSAQEVTPKEGSKVWIFEGSFE
jgi:hypothetical protein